MSDLQLISLSLIPGFMSIDIENELFRNFPTHFYQKKKEIFNIEERGIYLNK
jgi:hypothetical protein